MSRRVRLTLMLAAVLAVGACMALSFVKLPSFGSTFHPYRDASIPAAVKHSTANAVAAVNFDQRAIDTLGEETILLGSVVGAAALLRPSRQEREAGPSYTGRVLDVTRMLAYVLMPTTLIVGIDVVVHGHVTPGGGFQGGVILATGLHLLYVSGSYRALERLRPLPLFEIGEAVGAAAFACLGIAGLITSTTFLVNSFSSGSFGGLFSAGTVPLLNAAVGLEVGCGIVVLLSKFLDQAILLGRKRR